MPGRHASVGKSDIGMTDTATRRLDNHFIGCWTQSVFANLQWRIRCHEPESLRLDDGNLRHYSNRTACGYALETQQRCAERAYVIAFRRDVHLHAQALLKRANDPLLPCYTADERHLAIHADFFQQASCTFGERLVDAADNVLDGNASTDVVDDLALRQDRAHAADRLRMRGPHRQPADALERHLEILRRARDEHAGSGGALVVALEDADLTRIRD